MKKIAGFLVVLFHILSCEDSFREPDIFESSDFFPTDPSIVRTYLVDQINYEIISYDTSQYYLREQVIDSFSNAGIITYKLQIEIADSLNGEWKVYEIVPVRVSESEVVRRENGSDFVKMIFPVKENRTWDGNQYNTQTYQEYSFQMNPESIAQAEDLPEKMVQVIISDIPKNIVDQNQQNEIYADGVGLIEKNKLIFEFCTNEDCEVEIQSGKFLQQRLISYERQ